MWAAANRKRSRTDVAGSNLSESEYDSDTSSDGERSTTESTIHENIDDNAPPSTAQVRKKFKRKRRKKTTRENPEATMARLTSSYSAAMAAVGALHRLSRQYSKQNASVEKPKSGDNAEGYIQNDLCKNQNDEGENTPETTNDNDSLQKAHTSIQRVAHAARNAFEQSLLLDHVILAPILLSIGNDGNNSKTISSSSGTRTNEKDARFASETMSCTSSAWFSTWNCDPESKSISMVQWNRLNTAHRNSTKQLSYLTLVNYADLLLCGCNCHRSSLLVNDGKGQDTLDKGAVTRLEGLELFQQLEGGSVQDRTDDGHSNCCLWRDESRERTLRLAVAAYCDASDLDPTDPTMWLKLACAARALGRESDSKSTLPPKSFRFLEKLALERGLSSLPKGVPPNRLLLRAWREVQAREKRIAADSDGLLELVITPEESGPVERLLELPKYSWSTLGFTLLEASSCLPDEADFGSPQIGIRISPLLSSPSKILKRISGWLGRDDVNSMVLTCSSVAQVLTSTTTKLQEPKTLSSPDVNDNKGLSQNLGSQQDTAIVGSDAPNNGEANSSGKESESNTVDGITSPRRGRVSKRVQSQAITSEKQTERRAKRSSAEYCMLAGVLSSTAQNPIYRKLLDAEIAWDKLPTIKRERMQLQTTQPPPVDRPQCPTAAPVQYQNELRASSSLSTFIQNMSGANSGPIDALDKFLVHLSLHTRDIFGSENTDEISSCVIECFDKISDAAESYSDLVSPWYGEEDFDEANLCFERALQVVSVNLLVAELRFKKCECNESGDLSNDGIKLDFIVPNLLHCVSILSRYDTSDDQIAITLELKCRYYWLASTYYTWLGHRCNDISISKDADNLSLEYLDVCLESLSEYQQLGGEQSIKTPHLVSPDHRHGIHWASLSVDVLMSYKQYLLSTVVVSKVRQDFHTISCQLKEGLSTNAKALSIAEDQKMELSSLGAKLVNRYKPGKEKSNEKIEELFNDFILTHGDHIINIDESVSNNWEIAISTSKGKDVWGNVWSAIPSTKTESIEQVSSALLSSPSILQVLSCSLFLSEGDTQPLLSIYCQLISFALESRARIIQSSTADRIEKGNLMLLAAMYFADKLADKMSEASNEVNHELDDDFDEETFHNTIQIFQNPISVEPEEQIKESNDQGRKNSARHALFHSASRLVFAVQQYQGLSSEIKHNVESIYFVGLVKAFVQGKNEFASLITSVSDKRLKTWQIELNDKASKICFIANELAELMSKCTTCIDSEGNARVSHLIKGLVGLGNESIDVAPLAQFSDSLIWFWNFMNNRIDATSPSENAVKDRLLVSVCATMIALCGSPGVSVDFAQSISERKCSPTNSDYFDSDSSVNGVFLPDVSAESELQHSKRTLARKYSQLTQCVSLVFEFSERAASRVGCYPSSQYGPFLSLVTVRTLSNIADEIFALFSEDIWGEEWPYGARECGSTLDSVLSKAYSSLYGFSLITQAQSNDPSKSYAPESIMAAAQLFRSVKRVYNKHNRRSPPTRAFETIEMALPPAEENAVSKAITGYMFDPDKDIDSVRFSTVDTPPGFPECVFYEAQNAIGESVDDSSSCIEILRRGICRELAKCPISHIGSDEPEEGNEGLSEERESTQRYELSLGRKFRAVLDDLSYDPRNIENWIVLSECLGFKADIICDRLVRDKDPYDTSDFCPPMQTAKSMTARSLVELREIQSSEYTHKKWHPFIGKDLSVYIQYPWSNLNSLRDCSKQVESSLSQGSGVNNTETVDLDLQIWREIETIFEKGEYTPWANAWAGMFVAALRTMRMKALRVARYLAKKKLGKMHPSEVSEDIGTALYGDLMASTVYGFPMQHMCNYEKRSIAEGAKYYFEEAIESSKSTDYACDSKTESWEVQFMIGKCCEKIASTLCEEIYQSDVSQTKRMYETMMTAAIENYAAALGDAQKAEKAGGGQDNKNGGSSHGSREVLYRLHATRFKALLSAIRQAADERGLAETEACRISSTSWFDDSNKLQTSDDDIRHNIWDLYVDCVQGLSSCRKGISYFHRAAYRLAQALHWAPAFHDPCFSLHTGSIESIPSSKRERISELDKNSFAECAASVIGTLFDKKRSHLVAVWVTTSAAPPPFEVLNDSVRKYDALRLKYIRAFVDTMIRCKQRDKIETFLSWAASSSQDLAGFYEASAMTFQGGHIGKSLLSGSGFLTKVQRAAMTALAKMILQDLAEMKKDGIIEHARKLLKDDFKLSHNLFLRLHSTPEEIQRAAHSNKPLDEVIAYCRCYLSIQSGRINDSINLNGSIDNAIMLSSLLEGASEKAKEMFPAKKNKLKTLKRQAEDA